MKKRSTEQHRRFFAVVSAAFDHWPEAHKFRPDNAEHLRAWLLVKAKHSSIKTFHVAKSDVEEVARLFPIVAAVMTHRYCWCRPDGASAFAVCVPASIAFDKLDHEIFCRISADVEAVIEAETGMTPDDLLRASEAA